MKQRESKIPGTEQVSPEKVVKLLVRSFALYKKDLSLYVVVYIVHALVDFFTNALANAISELQSYIKLPLTLNFPRASCASSRDFSLESNQ